MPFNFNHEHILPVMQRQRLSNWCWAASTLFVCSWYQTHAGLTQAQLVARVLQQPICSTGVPYPACNKLHDLGIAFAHVGHLSGQPVNTPLTPAELVILFQQGGRPIGCQMLLPEIGGHAVVIINGRVNEAGKLFLQVGDPADGAILTMPYEIFRNNYRGHGGYWVRSYITKRQGTI